MKRTSRSRGERLGYNIIKSLRASLLACTLTALLVLMLALLLRWDVLEISSLNSWSIAIKAICACAAGMLHFDGSIKRLWVIAGLSGVLYIALSIAVFSLLSGEFTLKLSQLSDLMMGFACASCTCILRKMLHKEKPQKA